MMDLCFLGIGAAYFPRLQNTAAWFSRGDTAFLIDCGSTVFPSMMERFPFDGIRELVVLVTHLHADHTGSLGTLITYCQGMKNIRVTLAHPRDSLRDLVSLFGVGEHRYHYVNAPRLVANGVTAEFLPVPHSRNTDSYALLLSDHDSSLYYSGDAALLPPAVLDRFFAGSIERIYQDCSFLPGRKPGHLRFADLVKLIPMPLRHRVFPIHWDCEAAEIIKKEGFGLAAFPAGKAGRGA